MAGRGPQTFKKKQKEQQRKEKRQEKLARKLERRHQRQTETALIDDDRIVPSEVSEEKRLSGTPVAYE